MGETPAGEETVIPTSYDYDANGNLTDTGRWRYRYDGENRLVEAFDHVEGLLVRFDGSLRSRVYFASLVNDMMPDKSSGAFIMADKEYDQTFILEQENRLARRLMAGCA